MARTRTNPRSCAADIKAVDKGRKTALHYACLSGEAEVAKLLVERGARVGAKDKSRSPPLFGAALRGHPDVIALLIQAGASVQLKNRRGWATTRLSGAV